MVGWIVPIGFLLPSLIFVVWSLWRRLSRSNMYKKQQYYDKDVILKLI